jgi:hypothetical protein
MLPQLSSGTDKTVDDQATADSISLYTDKVDFLVRPFARRASFLRCQEAMQRIVNQISFNQKGWSYSW